MNERAFTSHDSRLQIVVNAMSNLEKQPEDGGKQIQTSPDSYSDKFNLDKGVDKIYEYKCNLGTLYVLQILLPSPHLAFCHD